MRRNIMKLGMAINLSLAVILSAATMAVAQGPAHEGMGPGMGPGMGGPGFGMHRPPMERALGMNGGRWWNNPEMIEKLKLTDDQRKAMDQILLDHRKDLIDKRGAVEKAELDLEPLMQDDQPTEGKVLAQIDKVAQARAELEKANARFLLAIRAKLSSEQWKQLKAARAERIEHRGWRDSRDGNKPPRPPAPDQSGPGPQGSLNEVPAPELPQHAPDTGSR
jgi:Spy/CpxP family protein refolding chaperone